MIDLSEKLLTVSEAARRFPRRPSTVSLWRWATKGVRGCKLRTVAVGGKRYVPESAIAEFLEACSAAANHETPSVAPPARRTTRQREADIKRAERILDAK